MTSQAKSFSETASRPDYFAIVPAAGVGTRMQADKPKQYLQIGDQTVLELSLKTLLSAEQIKQVVVCLAGEDPYWSKLSHKDGGRIRVAKGGATRAQSVLNGLTELSGTAKENDWVMVHDAARPCLSKAVLLAFIEALDGDEVGGILAIPARDTLKQAHIDSDYIDKTLNRSQIWHAQTPQMFRFGLLHDAMKEALARQIEITDEASAMEAAGLPVKLIEGDSRNIKITSPEDLLFARSVLEIELQ